MVKKMLMKSGALAVGLLGLMFVFIRLGMVAIALNIVLGTVHSMPLLQMASVTLCIATLALVVTRIVHGLITGADVIDRLHGLSLRTRGVFWLSVACSLAWALATMVLGDVAALAVAVVWATTVIAWLSYFLVREVTAFARN
jgi:hypothetical protein